MTVSVLIPAFRAERYIDETIGSVVAQTFSDWEVVAVDDASPDATGARIEEWASRDPRIRALHNESNRGMTGNWNRCLAEARRDLVIKLDADDVWKPRTLEILVEAMKPAESVGAAVRTLMCDEQLEPFDGIPGDDVMMNGGVNPYEDHTLDTARFYELAAHGHQFWSSSALMLRTEFLRASGGYDERFGCAADTELIWRTLEQRGSFAHRAYPGVMYRMLAGSISNVYRANDWVTWEATAGNMLSLSRLRKTRGLSRALSLRYAALWDRWQSHRQENGKKLPAKMCSNLDAVVANVEPPPLADRVLLRARNTAVKLLKG